MAPVGVRYSDDDLAVFKSKIEKKLKYARDDYEFAQNQIADQTENMESDGDWMDSSSSNNDLEMFYLVANRQKKHIDDLERALIRISNKTYGICQITGELIDKRRLLAVPTTTKSLAAKLGEVTPTSDTDDEEKPAKKEKIEKKKEPVVFSRILKKPSSSSVSTPNFDEKVEGYYEEDLELDFNVSDNDDEFDIVDPSSLETDEDE